MRPFPGSGAAEANCTDNSHITCVEIPVDGGHTAHGDAKAIAGIDIVMLRNRVR